MADVEPRAAHLNQVALYVEEHRQSGGVSEHLVAPDHFLVPFVLSANEEFWHMYLLESSKIRLGVMQTGPKISSFGV